MGSAAYLLLFVVIFVLLSFPAFVIGRRRGVRNAWAAFVPVLGAWIILFESVGKSGWYSLLVFIPTAGPLTCLLWTAFELPTQHERSRWWTLALVIPGLNFIGYWCYAFTLPRPAVAAVVG